MEDKTLSLFEDIPAKRKGETQRRPVPEIEKTCIPFDELKDKKIVITGKLFQMKRDEFRLWLEERSAKMLSSVSSHTDLLVVGKKPGGVKVAKAKKLDIPICYETEFFDKFSRQLTLKL